MQWHQINGVSGLLEYRDLWNQLWSSGHQAQTSSTAEGIEVWCRHFLNGRDFAAIVVESNEKLVAAIPVLRTTKMGVPIFELPVNCWANAGDLLVDSSCQEEAIQCLAEGMRDSLAGLVRLEEIQLRAPRWQSLFRALVQGGGSTRVGREAPVAIISNLNDWDTYFKGLRGNHRRSILRTDRRIRETGEIEIKHVTSPSAAETAQLVKDCFALEDMGWKGEQGTSVLKSPGMLEYYLDEAEMARQLGQLHFWLLEFNGELIAFEYCHLANGCCFAHKLSYHPEHSNFGPGRLLRKYQLNYYADDSSTTTFDMLGVMCDAKGKWANDTYPAGTCVVALRSPVTSTILRAYNLFRKPVCDILSSETSS